MIALDCQRVRAQRRHPLHHSWLLEGVLSGFNHGGRGGKLRDKNAKESWEIIEGLTLYDNESWNDSRDLTKPVKAISLPPDVPRKGEENPSSPKQVHFVNTITIVSGLKKKEEEEPDTSKIEEKGKSSVINKDDKSSNMSYVMDFTILENVEANIDPNGIGRSLLKHYIDPELEELTSEGHDLLTSRGVLSDDDVRRGCESP
ncbi:hypothetical protein Tco_0037667 [Tanacetum coccineum]